MNKQNKGFTLIEILVVIGIIAILAAVVLIAINPARQFRQANDSQRSSNVNAVLNAIGQRLADNKGAFTGTNCSALPAAVSGADITLNILNDNSALVAGTSIGLKDCLTPTYMSALPYDPLAVTTAADTKYDLVIESTEEGGRLTVLAPDTQEATSLISVTR